LVKFCQSTRRYNPEDGHLGTHRRESLKSYNTAVKYTGFIGGNVTRFSACVSFCSILLLDRSVCLLGEFGLSCIVSDEYWPEQEANHSPSVQHGPYEPLERGVYLSTETFSFTCDEIENIDAVHSQVFAMFHRKNYIISN
jgi:hypothetical protein